MVCQCVCVTEQSLISKRHCTYFVSAGYNKREVHVGGCLVLKHAKRLVDYALVFTNVPVRISLCLLVAVLSLCVCALTADAQFGKMLIA